MSRVAPASSMRIAPWTRSGAVLILAASLVGCSAVRLDLPKTYSEAIGDASDTHFGRAALGWDHLHAGSSGFFPLVDGGDALGARLDMIERAERSIDLQTFLMKDDTAARVVTKALIDAAERGVRVRFLLDDVFTSAPDRTLLALSQHPRIEVRLFNPISRRGSYGLNFLGSFGSANRRMHNKSMTVDNSISLVGGRNIADEYYQLGSDGLFADFDLLSLGSVAQLVSESFDVYWNHTLAVPIEHLVPGDSPTALEEVRDALANDAEELHRGVYREALSSDLLQTLISGDQPLFVADARVIDDDPGKLLSSVGVDQMRLAVNLDQILKAAENEVVFISPYYVPGRDGVDYVTALIDRGSRVVVVTNSLASNNHVPVHAGYARYRRDILEAGVELYEVRANAGGADDAGNSGRLTLHTKLVLVDRRYLIVGSLNLDPRSLEINSEMCLVVDSTELVEAMAAGLDEQIPATCYRVALNDVGKLEWRGMVDGQAVVETAEPLAGRWRRVKAWIFGIVPEGQL